MRLNKTWRRIAIGFGIVLAVLLLAAGGFVWWALSPYEPDDVAVAALESDEYVVVEETEAAWLFTPADTEPHVGLVIYPGGRVDARAYAPLAREVAEMGYLVAITPMPLNLAVFAPDAAQGVIDAHPEIVTWTISGHSLGGSMAASFANQNRDTIDGLALMAAYPAGSDDMSDVDFTVISIYGTRDGVLNEENFSEAASLLPRTTGFVRIEGGNHAQFGSYGPQSGDLEPTIKAEDQRFQTVVAIGEMLLPLRRHSQ
jgi:poly(3-hydroxybutyrate) depolymerase